MDYSYLGAGKAYLRVYGSAAPFIEVGNASAVSLGVTEQSITLQDHTKPGGGTYNEVKRIESVDVNMSLHDLSPANLALAFLGTASNTAGGTATEEEVVAYKGGFTPLARVPTAITKVETAGGGSAYAEGDDYEFRDGGIFIPDGSSITNPVAGAANIQVTYTYAEQDKVEGMTVAAKDWEMIFVGLNEARSGKPVRVKIHRVKFGPAQALALVSADEHAVLEITGKAQSDTSITSVGLSQYFTTVVVK